MAKTKSENGGGGLVSRVPQDNRPVSAARLPQPYNPAYAENMEITRTNVLLRNGTTVAIDDYEEEVHGKSVEESDEDYRRRMMSQPSGRPMGALAMPTTVANLHTFDSTELPLATPPVVQPVLSIVQGMPVQTSDDPNPNLVDLAPAGAPRTQDEVLDARESQVTAQQAQIESDRARLEAQREENKKRAEERKATREKAQKRSQRSIRKEE